MFEAASRRAHTAGTSLLAILGVIVLTACARSKPPIHLDLATVTSLKESGVIAAILPAFPDAKVNVHAAPSGRSLAMLADGIVDAVITNSPKTEAQYLTDHRDWVYQKFAYNRFVVIGPPEDPAEVRHASSAADAFQRIARSPMLFISRGEESGTSEREAALWKAAGVRPPLERLVVSGSGLMSTLKYADDRQGYALCDDGTFVQKQSAMQLVRLFDDDPLLLDTYAVIYPEDNTLAASFAAWLTRGEGRTKLSQFRVGDRSSFIAWPDKCGRTRPNAEPCR